MTVALRDCGILGHDPLCISSKYTIDLLVLHILVGQHVVDFLGGDGPLQLLSVQHFVFELLDGAARLSERLRHSPVSATWNEFNFVRWI